jgi:hypothetical protein
VKRLICADCGHEKGREDFCMECYLRASCKASGVPRYVEDPEAIRKIATLLSVR